MKKNKKIGYDDEEKIILSNKNQKLVSNSLISNNFSQNISNNDSKIYLFKQPDKNTIFNKLNRKDSPSQEKLQKSMSRSFKEDASLSIKNSPYKKEESESYRLERYRRLIKRERIVKQLLTIV
jgi:hypothetical protein